MFRALGFFDVLGRGGTGESDAFAVGRPERTGRAFGQIGNDPGFASREGENCELRRLGFSGIVFLSTANENETLAVRRPPRLPIVLPVGEANGRIAAGGGDAPDGGLVAGSLFVDNNTRKSDAGTVRRNLRVGNPHEIEKIFFGDGALSGRILSGNK